MTVAQVSKDVQAVAKMVDSHDKILVRGNGEPSLQEDMRSVQKDIAKILKQLEDDQRSREAYLKLFVAMVGAQLLAGVIAVAVYIIRIAPYVDEIVRHVQ